MWMVVGVDVSVCSVCDVGPTKVYIQSLYLPTYMSLQSYEFSKSMSENHKCKYRMSL